MPGQFGPESGGQHLHNIHVRSEPSLETDISLQYNYFQFIAESYDHNFAHGRSYLINLKDNHYNLNPEFHYIWSDNNGSPMEHFGTIVKNPNQKYKGLKISQWQQTFRLIKGNYEDFSVGEEVKVRLHFYLYGIMAEICKIKNDQSYN